MRIAGTMRQATVKPEIPSSMFPLTAQKQPLLGVLERPISNTSRRRVGGIGGRRKSSETCDEFGDDDIDDIDLVQAASEDLDFEHIENYGDGMTVLARQCTFNNTSSKKRKHIEPYADKEDDGPRRLPNGKWACNHKCKDKNACKHMCCRDGLHKPPKRPVKKLVTSVDTNTKPCPTKSLRGEARDKTQIKLQLSSSRSNSSVKVEHLDLTQKKNDYVVHAPQDYRTLHQLHASVQKKAPPSSASAIMHKKPAYTYAKGDEPKLSFLASTQEDDQKPASSSDYGNDWINDLPSPSNFPILAQPTPEARISSNTVHTSEVPGKKDEDMDIENYCDPNFGDDDSVLDAAMVGLADSQVLRHANGDDDDLRALEETFGVEIEDEYDAFAPENKEAMLVAEFSLSPQEDTLSSAIALQTTSPEKGHSLFFNNTSNPKGPYDDLGLNGSFIEGKGPAEIEKTPHIVVKQSDGKPAFENIHAGNTCVSRGVPPQPDGQPFNSIVIPPGYEDVEPWLIAEFGDIVEFT